MPEKVQRSQFLCKSTWWTLWQPDCLPPPILGACEKYCALLAGMWSKMTHKSSFISAVVLAEKDELRFSPPSHSHVYLSVSCALEQRLLMPYLWCMTHQKQQLFIKWINLGNVNLPACLFVTSHNSFVHSPEQGRSSILGKLFSNEANLPLMFKIQAKLSWKRLKRTLVTKQISGVLGKETCQLQPWGLHNLLGIPLILHCSLWYCHRAKLFGVLINEEEALRDSCLSSTLILYQLNLETVHFSVKMALCIGANFSHKLNLLHGGVLFVFLPSPFIRHNKQR